MLLAEKLGLVVLTTRTGRGDFELASVDVACSGLLLIDLVLAGRVADDGDGLVVVKRKKLAAPLLNEALTALSAKNQQSTRRQLAAVGRRLGGRSEQTSRAVFDQPGRGRVCRAPGSSALTDRVRAASGQPRGGDRRDPVGGAG